ERCSRLDGYDLTGHDVLDLHDDLLSPERGSRASGVAPVTTVRRSVRPRRGRATWTGAAPLCRSCSSPRSSLTASLRLSRHRAERERHRIAMFSNLALSQRARHRHVASVRFAAVPEIRARPNVRYGKTRIRPALRAFPQVIQRLHGRFV